MAEEAIKTWGDYIRSEVTEWAEEGNHKVEFDAPITDAAHKATIAAWMHKKFNLPGTSAALEAKNTVNEMVMETIVLLDVIPKPKPYLLYQFKLMKEEEAKKIAEGKDTTYPIIL